MAFSKTVRANPVARVSKLCIGDIEVAINKDKKLLYIKKYLSLDLYK